MIDRKISIRYAKALDKICEDNNLNERDALEYLRHFSDTVYSNTELYDFLKMSIIPIEKRINVIDELLSNEKDLYIKKFVRKDIADKLIGTGNNLLKEFVKYMLRKGRLELLSEVLEIFEEIVNKKENRLKAAVLSAIELSDTEKEELKKALETKFQKTIEVEFIVNEKLMAGIVVKIDDVVYDGSINTYLNNLKRKLLRLPL